MKDLSVAVMKYLVLSGICFGLFVAIRKTVFDERDFETLKKGDGMILGLILFAAFVLVGRDNAIGKYFDITYLYRTGYYGEPANWGLNWIPLKAVIHHNHYMPFKAYVSQSSDYQVMSFLDILVYYGKNLVLVLPIAYVSYLVSDLKKRGFGLGLLVTIVCGLTMEVSSKGDFVLMFCLGFGLVALVMKWLEKSLYEKQVWPSYLLFLIIMGLAVTWCVDYSPSSGRMAFIEADDPIFGHLTMGDPHKTYKDQITMTLDEAEIIKQKSDLYTIRFYGQMAFDPNLLADTPFADIDVTDVSNFHVSYAYAYEGVTLQFGSNVRPFGIHDDDWYDNGLIMYNYVPIRYEANHQDQLGQEEPMKEAEQVPFFQFLGITDVQLQLMDYIEDYSDFEIIDRGFGQDEYLYYEVNYEVNGYGLGDQLRWIIHYDVRDTEGAHLSYELAPASLIDTIDGIETYRQRIYFYDTPQEAISHVDVNLLNGFYYLGEADQEEVFSLERDMFK